MKLLKCCEKEWHSRLGSATRNESEGILLQILSNKAKVGKGA